MLRLASRRLPSIARSFSTTAVKRDLIQDLYLKEIKSFKPTARAADDAEGAVRNWSVPKAPQAPTLETAEATNLSEYEAQAVEVEDKASVSSEGEAAPTASFDEWFVVEDTFAESAAEHH